MLVLVSFFNIHTDFDIFNPDASGNTNSFFADDAYNVHVAFLHSDDVRNERLTAR